jgi:hypothetical protein
MRVVAEVRCIDGSVLTVLPVPVLDRHDVPYEVTLRLLRDGASFGEVGERCGWFVATTAARLRQARALDGEQALPASSLEAGLRAWAAADGRDPERTWASVARYLPRDRELFAFRSRDPDDISALGELRVCLRSEPRWRTLPGGDGRGRWEVRTRAVLEAFGSPGTGVRAVLTSGELLAFLTSLVRDFAAAGVPYDLEDQEPYAAPEPATDQRPAVQGG